MSIARAKELAGVGLATQQGMFLHCKKCLESLSGGISMREYARLEVLYEAAQNRATVKCVRHDKVVVVLALRKPEKDSIKTSRRPTEEEVQGALAKIMADQAQFGKSLNYAVNYVKAGQQLTGEALRVQCLYIVSNIGSWRHADAQEVRAILRRFSKP